MEQSNFKRALYDEMHGRYAALLENNAPHEFSDAFELKMDKLINRRRKPYFRMINTVGKRVACIALAVFIASATTVMSVDALRNAFFGFIMHIFDRSSIVQTVDDEYHPDTIEERYDIGYNISGYSLDMDIAEDTRINRIYKNGNDLIYFDQYTKSTFDLLINTEDADVQHIDINGYDTIYYLDNNGYHTFIWDNGRYILMLSANTDKETAESMVKSVKKAE